MGDHHRGPRAWPDEAEVSARQTELAWKDRKVRLRKLLAFRRHYEGKSQHKRFLSVGDWNAHRMWVLAGEQWLVGPMMARKFSEGRNRWLTSTGSGRSPRDT